MVKFTKKRYKIVIIVIGIVVVVSTFAAIFFFRKKANEEIVYDPNQIVTESVGEPEESKPKEYEVPADLPKRILIPKIYVKSLIQLVSIDQYGRIAVPNNIYVAGWYINSVRPGEEGLSIIGGHRDGKKKPGIFFNLEKLKRDDKISIEYGDGSLREFLVIDVVQLPTQQAHEKMYERIEGVEKQLVLVTCGGQYDQELGGYEDRVILRARGV